MIIGITEENIRKKMNVSKEEVLKKINEAMAQYSDTDIQKYARLQKLEKEIEQINNDVFSGIYTLIVAASAFSYVHTRMPSYFLLSAMSGLEPPLRWTTLKELKQYLKNPIVERDIKRTLTKHKQSLNNEIKATVKAKVFTEMDSELINETIDRSYEKHANKVEFGSSHEIGLAQSQALLDVEEEWTDIPGNLDLVPKKFWLSQRDGKVRATHKVLDGNTADKDGFFHSEPTKTKGRAPRKMEGAFAMQENARCRCSLGFKIGDVEIDEMDKENMSDEHKAVYEKTNLDRYKEEFLNKNVHPAYYKQLSKRVMFDRNELERDKEEYRNTPRDDAKVFQDMISKGYRKKKDGTWGY